MCGTMSTYDTQIAEFKQLVAETKLLLKNRPVWMSYPVICRATGLKYSWLNKFACSEHTPANPKITTLHDYLVKNKQELA